MEILPAQYNPRYNGQQKKTKAITQESTLEETDQTTPETPEEEKYVPDKQSQDYLDDLLDDKAKKKYESLQSTKTAMQKYAEDIPMQTKTLMIKMLFKQIEMMNQETYSAKSWNKLMAAYKNAKKTMQKEDLTPEKLQKEIEKLRTAMASLELITMEEKKEEEENRENLPFVVDKDVLSSNNGVEVSAASMAPSAGSIDISV